MSIDQINRADSATASHLFRQCCTSDSWINRMVADRPYNNEQSFRNAANDNWQGLAEQDYLQAFDGHPKIGDVGSLKAKYLDTKELAAGEQSAVNEAGKETIQTLADANAAYEDKFGFIFIVCATGKSAGEMLQILQARLPNNRQQEIVNAAEEQRKIFQIRLEKLI